MYAITPFNSTGLPDSTYLVGKLNLAQVSTIVIRRTGSNQTDDTLLITRQLQLVVTPRLADNQLRPGQSQSAEAQRLCVQGSSGTIQTDDYRGVPAVIDYRWLAGPQLCLIVKLDQAEVFASSRTLDQALLVVGLIGFILAMLVAMLFSTQIARPLNELVQGVEAFGQGQLDLRLPVDSDEEIGRLRAAFNRMAANLQHSLGQLNESQASQTRYKNYLLRPDWLSTTCSKGASESRTSQSMTCTPQRCKCCIWKRRSAIARRQARSSGVFIPFVSLPAFSKISGLGEISSTP